jgi:hypothetical protein
MQMRLEALAKKFFRHVLWRMSATGQPVLIVCTGKTLVAYVEWEDGSSDYITDVWLLSDTRAPLSTP